MPISPRPPSGGGRPWSSTAIPPAYRRKRIATCERSIPLLTTRGYPLVLGDKIPMRPLSCVPGQHSTPVLAPPRPASSASVPMKATIKENTFKELVKYWEQTTLEKIKTSSSLNPTVKSDKSGNQNANLCNKTTTDVNTADVFPEADVPHTLENLPLFCKDNTLHNTTAADVDIADAFPKADVPHKLENLPMFKEEVVLCNKTKADVDTADAFPEPDVPHTPENLRMFSEDTTLHNKTTSDVDTVDVFPEADVPHKPENLPLFKEEVVLCNKTKADVDTADAFPEPDVPHTPENLRMFSEDTTLHNKTTADVDTANAFPEPDVPHTLENLQLFSEDTTLHNKTTSDVDTANAFPEADVPHKPGNLPLFGDGTTLRNKTATDVDTADAFPEADVPHKPENLSLFADGTTLRNLTAAYVDTADAFSKADVPHKPENLSLFGDGTTLRNQTAADDAFSEADVPHKPENLSLFSDGTTLRNQTAADVDTADLFSEADVPHKHENLHLFAILRNKRTADMETVDAFPEADLPHVPGNLLQPDIHAGAIQNHLNVEMLKKEFLHAHAADHIAINQKDTLMQISNEMRVARHQDLTISGIGFSLPENIEIDLRRARTLDQHLASVKQKVAANTARDEWHRINELRKRKNIVDNILKEIIEKSKFVNKEMMDIESESFLISSKMETPRCIDRREKEPPSNIQTQTILPPIPTKAKPTAEVPSKNTNKYNTSSSPIVKSSSLPRQMKTKPLPAIVPHKGNLNPVRTQRRPQTDIDNEYKQLQRAVERVGRHLGQTLLQEHISYHEHEPGRPMRGPRNEQDNVPCRGKSKETKNETGFKEKPNQRKRNRNQQKKKKIEKAPIKIEDRPPFSAEVKPSKYFSDISRLSDAS